jgi:hypothetical protein
MKTMTPGLRKVGLVAHVTASVGWLGAVVGFLALAICGLMSPVPSVVRASYIAMELVGWCVFVPLSIASLLTGVVQGMGTSWGLFRHYWVVAKLAITVVASALLLLHMRIASHMAEVATLGALGGGDLRALRIQLIADAAGAVVVLLIATALSVFKPQGLTGWGARQAGVLRGGESGRGFRLAAVIAFVALLVLIVVKHLTSGGMMHPH